MTKESKSTGEHYCTVGARGYCLDCGKTYSTPPKETNLIPKEILSEIENKCCVHCHYAGVFFRDGEMKIYDCIQPSCHCHAPKETTPETEPERRCKFSDECECECEDQCFYDDWHVLGCPCRKKNQDTQPEWEKDIRAYLEAQIRPDAMVAYVGKLIAAAEERGRQKERKKLMDLVAEFDDDPKQCLSIIWEHLDGAREVIY